MKMPAGTQGSHFAQSGCHLGASEELAWPRQELFFPSVGLGRLMAFPGRARDLGEPALQNQILSPLVSFPEFPPSAPQCLAPGKKRGDGLRPPAPQSPPPGWRRVRPPTRLALVPAVAVPVQAVGKEEGLSTLAGVQQGRTERRGPGPFRGWTIREKAHSRGIHIWDEPEPGPAL